MSSSLEWIEAGSVVVTPRIAGDEASDGQEVEPDDLAVEVASIYGGDGAIFTGSREALIELSARILEAAIHAHVRYEAPPAPEAVR